MKNIRLITLYNILLLFIFPNVFQSCDNETASPIPNVSVDLRLNLSTVYINFRNSVNDTLVFDPYDEIYNEQPGYGVYAVGYGGILVYTDLDGNYMAFDLCCPYETESKVRVYPNESGEAVCKKCGSKFILYYGGAVSQGPSKYPLKKYQAYKQNTTSGEYLIIQN